MSKFAKLSLYLTLGYLAAWLVAYTVVMGADFGYVVEYFKLGWSFSGGEYPAYIWLGSVVIFIGAIGLAALFKGCRRYFHRAPNKALKMDAR